MGSLIEEKKKLHCDHCPIKGYSPELCRFHFQQVQNNEDSLTCFYNNNISISEMGKTAAIGAGIGVAAAFIGLAAIPSAAIKTLFGHVAAAKIGTEATGGAAGAGYNVYRKTKKNKKPPIKNKNIFPIMFNEKEFNEKQINY